MSPASAWRSVTNLNLTLVAMVLGVIGLALLVLAQWSVPKEAVSWSSFLAQLGGLLLASGLVTVGWEMAGRRSFSRELMDMAGLNHDLQRSGLLRIDTQYLTTIWDDLFESATKLDIVVAYAATWRNSHRRNLERLAAKSGSRIRVFLPDPDDALTMEILSNRFNTNAEALKSKVREAADDFVSMRRQNGGTVEVWLRAGDLLFSCYRFDSRAVITLYSHTRERQSSLPTFVTKEGDLFGYVRNELDAIARDAREYLPAEPAH